MLKDTVNIRVYEETWKRLKKKCIKDRKPLMVVVDELSKLTK